MTYPTVHDATFAPMTGPSAHPQRPPAWTGYALATVLVAAATLAAVVVNQLVAAPNPSLVFVLPVVITAVSYGWGPALTSAVLGAGAYNYFLIPPLYTLRVDDPANVWALVLLLLVAAIVSWVADQSRRRALDAWSAADQAAALETLGRALAGAGDRQSIAAAATEALARLFGAPAVLLDLASSHESGAPEVLAQAAGAQLNDADREAAKWALATRLPTRGGAYPVGAANFDFWPVVTPQRAQLAIGLAISGGDAGRPAAPERLVEAVAGYLSVALDREAFARQMLEGRVQKAGEQLKADLLAAVSHDLRTPLATILVTLQSLKRFADGHDPQARDELLTIAETETARLARMVANLLDMNRLDAGAVSPRVEAADARDLIDAAVRACGVDSKRLKVRADADAPKLKVDASLFESALANVLENARKYAPGDGEITITVGAGEGEGWIEVADRGPGFSGPVEPLFAKFTRGVTGDGRAPGTGLGLSIARGFLEAQGGRVEASNRDDGPGARVRLIAPLAGDKAPAKTRTKTSPKGRAKTSG